MDEAQFKPFHETYRIITFAMCIGMIYPNPEKRRLRIFLIFAIMGCMAPVSIMVLYDIYKSWLRKDISNIFRHSTVVGPFLGGFFKMFLMNFYELEFLMMIEQINSDYASYNKLPSRQRDIVAAAVRNSRVYTERCWAICVTITVLTFPLMAVVLNVYSFAFTSDPVKYMVHDVPIPFTEPEVRFGSPQFELFFVYMVLASTLYVINFTAYDGFFGLCINHACLKMQMYCCWMEDAMDAVGQREIGEGVARVIASQCELFR